jgi:hypothetical protein
MFITKFHAKTTATPEQDVAGLTEFGPGRAERFCNSADDDLVVQGGASGHTYTFTRNPGGDGRPATGAGTTDIGFVRFGRRPAASPRHSETASLTRSPARGRVSGAASSRGVKRTRRRRS